MLGRTDPHWCRSLTNTESESEADPSRRIGTLFYTIRPYSNTENILSEETNSRSAEKSMEMDSLTTVFNRFFHVHLGL